MRALRVSAAIGQVTLAAIPIVAALIFAITGWWTGAMVALGIGLFVAGLVAEVHRRGSTRLAEPSGSTSGNPTPAAPTDPVPTAQPPTSSPNPPPPASPDGVHFKARRRSFFAVFAVTVMALGCGGVAGLCAFAAVFATVRGRPEALLLLAPALLFGTLAGRLLGPLAAQLHSGFSGRPLGVWLTEQAVVVRLGWRPVRLRWSDIGTVHRRMVFLGRGLAPRVAVEVVQIMVARGTHQEVGVTISHTLLATDLDLLHVGLRHYLTRPADRHELRGAADAAITRIEAAVA